MAAVGIVTIHHEGGGAPSDNVSRFGHGGYCYGIGITRWERFRSPQENWATLNFNHKDLTICLSGNRMNYSVTDSDIQLIHGAYIDCYNRKEVTDDPLVRAHRNSPGSSTACPGDLTMLVWPRIVRACRPGAVLIPPPPPSSKGESEMNIIAVTKQGTAGNQKPYGYLDPVARKVWSCFGFKIAWDGGSGDSVLTGQKDPKSMGIPGSADIIGWKEIDYNDDGTPFDTKGGSRARVCAYGMAGAEYNGVAHG